MKRVLLTGAGGFVGSHTLLHLLRHTDWHVIATDSFRHRGCQERISEQLRPFPQYHERLEVLTLDLTVPFSRQTVHRLGQIDYLISMASASHVDRSIVQPREFIENNVALMLTLLEYAREHGVEKFLQVSTDEVYGPAPEHHAHREGEPHRPSNPYAASKAAQEHLAFSYWRTYGLPLILTNTMNIIGEMQDPEKFVPGTLARIARGEEVTIHASPEGRPGSRFYLHARNQADALVFLLRNAKPVQHAERLQHMNYGVKYHDRPLQFNVVGEREIDNLTMARLVAKYAGEPLRYRLEDFHASRPGHDLRYALDGTRLRDLGWTPPMPLEESLERTVKWTLAHPEWML